MALEERTSGHIWEFHDKFFPEDCLYSRVEEAADRYRLFQTAKALPLAKSLHEGQVRKGESRIPYINHPLTVACHALALGFCEDDIMAAALLHDVVEDCAVEAEDLPVCDAVKTAVRLLSFCVREGETEETAKKRYYQAISQNGIAAVVKVLDRCSNISSMAGAFSKEKIAQYIEETEQHIMPMLTGIRQRDPKYENAAFLLEYHMRSVLESLKRML